QVPRDESGETGRPRGAAIFRQPYAGRGHPDRKTLRVAGPGADRMQRESAEPRLPVAGDPLLPQRFVQAPRCSSVRAHEQGGRSDAGVQHPVGLARGDDPYPIDRCVGALREGRTLRGLPLAEGIIGPHHARPEEAARHACEVATRPRVTDRELDDVTLERPRRDLERVRFLTSEDEQSLLRSHQQLTHASSSPCDGCENVDRVVRADLRVFPYAFPVEEHVDVLANPALVIEDPPDGLRPGRFQGTDHGTDVGAAEPELAVPSRKVLQRRAQDDDRHPAEPIAGHALVGGGVRYSKCIPSGIRNVPPQSNPQCSKIFTTPRFIVGVEPYGFSGALMSIAAPYAWLEGGAVVDRATVRAA